MNQAFQIIIFAIMLIVGGGSTLFLAVSFVGVIIWKIYRHIKYGYKITD